MIRLDSPWIGGLRDASQGGDERVIAIGSVRTLRDGGLTSDVRAGDTLTADILAGDILAGDIFSRQSTRQSRGSYHECRAE